MRDGTCAGVRLLESLSHELAEVAACVAADDEKHGQGRKEARYFLYRKWVGAKWGYLGRGKRIRIPPCVIEAIRDRFREPGCDCAKGGDLFRCSEHGYTGHRDAP